jgi:hypothetical protein
MSEMYRIVTNDKELHAIAMELQNQGDTDFYGNDIARVRNPIIVDGELKEESYHVRRVGDRIILTDEGQFPR